MQPHGQLPQQKLEEYGGASSFYPFAIHFSLTHLELCPFSQTESSMLNSVYIYIYTRRRRKDQAARKEENTKGEKIIGDERTEEESKKGKTHLKRQSVVNRVWNSFSRRYKTLKRGQGMFTLVLSLGALKNATDCGEVKVLHAKASELQAKGYLIDALEHYQR